VLPQVSSRRPNAWWYAAGAAVCCGYLYVADPTKASTRTILPCPFKTLTGLDCPMCGATRASWALLHGHVVRALGYNVLWCALVPLLVWAWALEARGSWAGARHPFRARWFWPALIAAGVAFAVVRNLPFAALRSLHS
jgi:hypothetical protein